MQTIESLGVAVLRIVTGIIFTVHGIDKLLLVRFAGVARNFAAIGIPLPDISSVVVTLVEFLGGLMLCAGLFTRPAAVVIAIEMAVAIGMVHLRAGFFMPRGFEYPLALLAINVALALTGPGAFSLDAKIIRNRIF